MKTIKITSFILAIGFVTIFSCSKKEDTKQEVVIDSSLPKDETKNNDSIAFDIASIPISEVNFNEVGKFPFVELPENMKYMNKPLEKDLGEIYFPVGKNHDFIKLSGKTFKAFIQKNDNSKEDWSTENTLKSYDEAIKKLGGVLIFDGKMTKEQTDFLNNNDKNIGEEGSIDYWNEPVKVYAIRSAKNDNIYIQLYANSASGAIQILQEEAK